MIFRARPGQVGRDYDFDFDFTDFEQLSCSELVFFAMRASRRSWGWCPEQKRVAFLERTLIPTPTRSSTQPLELA